MTELSPQAQAVLDAFLNGYICRPRCNVAFEADRNGIAATLRAAADQVVPEEESCEGGFSDSFEHQCRASERRLVRAELLAIAAELEGVTSR
jgi:hypothetical protein